MKNKNHSPNEKGGRERGDDIFAARERTKKIRRRRRDSGDISENLSARDRMRRLRQERKNQNNIEQNAETIAARERMKNI